MQTVASVVRRAENLISFSALLALVGCVLWGVLTRYITERPAVWTTELSGILFTWVVFIGANTAFLDGRHIRVTLLVDLLPKRAGVFFRLFADLAVIAFLIAVTVLSIQMMLKGATRMSPVLDIPFSLVYLATVLAFSLMTITATLRLFGILSPAEDTAAPEEFL